MVLLHCFVQLVVLNHNQKQFGVRLINIKFRDSVLLTKWTVPEPTFFEVLTQIKDRLGANPIPLQIPIGEEENFTGIVDLIRNKAFEWDDSSKGVVMVEIPILNTCQTLLKNIAKKLIESVAARYAMSC